MDAALCRDQSMDHRVYNSVISIIEIISSIKVISAVHQCSSTGARAVPT